MTSTCRSQKFNLVPNKVYTILNSFEIDNNEPIKLVKLKDNF